MVVRIMNKPLSCVYLESIIKHKYLVDPFFYLPFLSASTSVRLFIDKGHDVAFYLVKFNLL